MTKIIVNNIWSRIHDLKDIKIVDKIDRSTSFYIEGYQYSKAFVHGYFDKKKGQFIHWDGKRHLLTSRLVFPTGLLHRIKTILDKSDVTYEVVDNRTKVKKGKELEICSYTPRDYQRDAVKKAIQNDGGMLRLATGAGKTLCVAMLAAHYNLPTNIYVVGKDLLYQFHAEMKKMLGIDIGLIGDGHCDIKKINVCSVWTAVTSISSIKAKISIDDEDVLPEKKKINSKEKEQLKKCISNAKVAIFDEAHFLATDTLQSIHRSSKECRYFFGLTGTNFRDDGADILLEAVVGKQVCDISASKLIKDGYLSKANIKFLEVPSLPGLPNNYQSIYNKYITTNNVRNKMVEDTARILVKKGRKVLILVRFLSHGEELVKRLSDMSVFFVNGEVDGETRTQVKTDLENGDLSIIIASSVFDIGVDLPSLDGLILAGSGKSSVRALQRIGRVIRKYPNKKNALIVDFLDNAKYLNKQSATRIAVYGTEDMFKLIFPKGFDPSSLKTPHKNARKLMLKSQKNGSFF